MTESCVQRETSFPVRPSGREQEGGPTPRAKALPLQLYLLQALQDLAHVLLLAFVWLEGEVHCHAIQGYLGHTGGFSGRQRGWLIGRLWDKTPPNISGSQPLQVSDAGPMRDPVLGRKP